MGADQKQAAVTKKPSVSLASLNASHPLSATSPSVKPIAGTKKSCSALMTPSGGTTLWEAIKYVFPTMTTAGSIIALADSPVPGPADVLGLIVAGGGTLVVGLGVYAYVNLINPYVTLEPQTPTIISDPVPDITLPQIEIIPELVPDIGSIILPFPFAQEDVSSNITSIPSLEEEGVQIITADGSGSSSSLKKIRSNARANEIARQLGYDGAEDLKEAFVGRSSISKFNMMYDTKTGEIVLVSIEDSSIQVQTGLFIE